MATAACAGFTLPLVGCKKQSTAQEQSTIHKDHYEVRGIVVQLPSAESPLAEFQVRHEAMPNFRGENNEIGMDTMTMPFPLAGGLTLEGLAVGDKINLAFEVDFDTATGKLKAYRATGFTKLPPETELDFSPLAK